MPKQIDGKVRYNISKNDIEQLDLDVEIDINDLWEKLDREQCDKFFFDLLNERYIEDGRDREKIRDILETYEFENQNKI